MISETFDVAHDWLQSHNDWLGPSIALVAFIESLVAIGIVVPGVAILFALGALAGSGLLEPFSMFVWGVIGAVLGDAVSFQIGYLFQDRVRQCWPFKVHKDWLAHGERFFDLYGSLSIAIGRFVGPVRPVIPVVAGMMNMQPLRFYSINILSSIPWALVYLTPGYFTGAALQVALPDSFYGLIVALFGVALLLSALFLLIDTLLVRYYLYTVLPLIGLIVVHAALGMLTVMDVTGQFDDLNVQIQSFISVFRVPVLLYAFNFITNFGSLYILLILLMMCSGYLFYLGEFKRLGTLAFSFIGMELMLWLMKWAIDKPRPGNFDGLDQFSFPSGHTTQAAFVGLILVFSLFRNQGFITKFIVYTLSLFCILLVALSRLMLEVHWFSDVTAGLLLGSLWFSVNVLVERQS